MIRRTIAAAILALAGADTPHAGRVAFDIPAGPAIESLVTWGQQSRMQMLFDYEHLAHIGNTRAVRGELDKFEALRRMTAGTCIEFYIVSERTIVVDLNQ